MDSLPPSTTQYLVRPGGRIGYDRTGSGPALILVPGMGELRQSYRHVAPALAGQGWEVVTMDLRGHGDSDPGFDSYGDAETAEDVLALIEQLGRPALIVGNSMAAAAAVIAASRRPELLSGIVLVGPFVRDGGGGPVKKALTAALMRLLLAPVWAASAWNAYLPSLHAGRRPADFEQHRARIAASLRRPGYAAAFSRTTRISHADAEAVLGRVSTPALVVMGARDPDFPDPAAEAAWIAEQIGAETVMIPDVGHYPQSQDPEAFLAGIRPFLDRTRTDGGTRA